MIKIIIMIKFVAFNINVNSFKLNIYNIKEKFLHKKLNKSKKFEKEHISWFIKVWINKNMNNKYL